jgi:hypothetical protein
MKQTSVKRLARIAGALYLIIFVAAPFPFLIGRGAVVVPGDTITTAQNLLSNQVVVRIGMVAETIVFLVEVLLAAIFYALLRPVSRHLSLASAFARLGESAVQAVNLLTTMLALMIVGGAGSVGALSLAQHEALALLFLDANGFGILIWGFFFGLHLLLLGYLVFRSTFWPKVLGILLIVAGFGYLAQGYFHILAPRFDQVLSTVVLVLAVPGELVFTVWLLWKGVNVDRWKERAADPAIV